MPEDGCLSSVSSPLASLPPASTSSTEIELSQPALFAQNRELQRRSEANQSSDLGQELGGNNILSDSLFLPELDEKSSEIGRDDDHHGDDEGDPSTAEEDYVCDLPRVNFMARWRIFSGKETLPGLSTCRESSRNMELDHLFSWAKRQVNRQLPVRYSIRLLTATVYFQKQPKTTQWVQTLEEERQETMSRFLRMLAKKREEREQLKPKQVKEIWVDFDLFLMPDSRTYPGNQFGTGRTPTERQLNQLPFTQAELLATEGSTSDVIIFWKCTSTRCYNHLNVCWVALREGEALPGRVEQHYPVRHNVLYVWNREIRMNISTVLEPSETVRALLRQERERRRTGMRGEARGEAGGASTSDMADVKELLSGLIKVYSTKAAAELAAQTYPVASSYVPFGSKYPPHKVVQGFFQWWYDQESTDDFYQGLLPRIGNHVLEQGWDIEFLRNSGKLTGLLWKEIIGERIKSLYDMRLKIEQFVKDEHWETYVDQEQSWKAAIFDPELYTEIAEDAEALEGIVM